MGKEREHKYLVVNDSYIGMASDVAVIRQGYLSRDKEATVRVRIYGEKGFLTVKGITTGDTREEYEYEIPLGDAEAMLRLCKGKIIEKERYIIDYEGFRWEVDRFRGENDSLVVAEIELDEGCAEYPLPGFVGKEVTGDPRYYNSML